jgi:uncharacterized membrane protein (DUF373 family)
VYSYLFEPFWQSVYCVIALVGAWYYFNPATLLNAFSAKAFSEEMGRKFHLSFQDFTRVLEISERQGDFVFNVLATRLLGATFFLCGCAAFTWKLHPVFILSVVTVVSAICLSVTFLCAKRNAQRRFASLSPSAVERVPFVLILVLVFESLAEVLAFSVNGVMVAVSTAVCAIAIVLVVKKMPIVLSGADCGLDAKVDKRFRVSRIGIIAIMSQLPALVWTANIEQLPPLFAEVAVGLGFLAVSSTLIFMAQKCERDLLQALLR